MLTNAAPEAVVDRFKGKGLPEYRRLMRCCFEEHYRVLKPGRWITVAFHNSKTAVSTAIQQALLAAGFVFADARATGRRHGASRRVTGAAAKQNLVISAYKPDDGLEERFALERGTENGVWEFVRAHLGQLPVPERKRGLADADEGDAADLRAGKAQIPFEYLRHPSDIANREADIAQPIAAHCPTSNSVPVCRQ